MSTPQSHLEDLEASMEIVGVVVTEGDAGTRVAGLCMMALLVSQYPPGPLQDLAEDILCTFIAEAALPPQDLAEVRRIRHSSG